jgi:hypothetical protein
MLNAQPPSCLTRDQALGLVALAGVLREEAVSCADLKQWHAALVLLGSAIEAGLLATACACELELRRSGCLPRGRKAMTTYTLGELLDLAHRAGWFPRTLKGTGDIFEPLTGELGDAAQFLLKVRNAAIHPGNHIRTLAKLDVDYRNADQMEPTYQLFDGITEAVFAKLRDVIESL